MAAGVFALTNCILVSNSNPTEGESAIRQILLPFLCHKPGMKQLQKPNRKKKVGYFVKNGSIL